MLTTENINDTAGDFVPGVIPANFADLHWSQRRKLVEINGSTWTNAEDAHAFLTGLMGVPSDADKTGETPDAEPDITKVGKYDGIRAVSPASFIDDESTLKFDIKRGYGHHVTDNGQWYEQDGYKFGTNGLYIGKA